MSGLKTIAVKVEPTAAHAREWGNSLPILHEIRHGLVRLAQSGERTLIDLNAIPFGPGDEERLLALLGTGEVQASLDALGISRIWESAIPGVWVTDHYNADNERVALRIEVNRIPEILCTQDDEIQDAVALLDARLQAAGSGIDERG